MEASTKTVKEILISMGYTPRECGSRFACLPLYRKSDNHGALSVDKNTGLWYDFKLGKGGSLKTLMEITLHLSPEEAEKRLEDFQAIIIEDAESIIQQVKIYDPAMLSKLVNDHRYWEARNIPKSVVEKFRGGIAQDGRLAYRYVFPIFNGAGKLIGFAGRDIIPNSNRLKWKIIGSKKHFDYPYYFNHEQLHDSREVILVESIGDMLSLWHYGMRNTLVTFGLHIMPETLKALLKVSPKRIIIALNRDVSKKDLDGNEIGLAGQRAAEKMRSQLSENFDRDTIKICIPEKNDFNEMSREEFDLWKKNLSDYPPQE